MANITQNRTECENPFAGRVALTSVQSSAFTILLGLLILTTFMTNLLLIVSLIKTKQLTNGLYYLVLILSISDCFAGLVTQPAVMILFTLYINQQTCDFEKFVAFLSLLNIHFSSSLVTLIAFERCAVLNPRQWRPQHLMRWLSSKTGIAILSVIGFMVSSAISFTYICDFKTMLLVIIFSIDMTFIAIIYVAYFYVYFTVSRFARVDVTRRNELSQVEKVRQKYLQKLATTVFLILAFMGFMTLPYPIMGYIYKYRRHSSGKPSTTFQFLVYLSFLTMCSNGTINALLFILRNGTIKTYIAEHLLMKLSFLQRH